MILFRFLYSVFDLEFGKIYPTCLHACMYENAESKTLDMQNSRYGNLIHQTELGIALLCHIFNSIRDQL